MDMLQIRSNSTFDSRIASLPRVCNQSRPLKESDQEFIQDIRKQPDICLSVTLEL